MRVILSVIMVIAILSGCGNKSDSISEAMELRRRLSKGESTCFEAVVTADYGDRIYTFTVASVAQNTGAVDFTVVSPETIAGITGSVSEGVGKLTFDDTVLLFEPLTQGQLTPAIGPWLMIKAILGGYIRSVSNVNDALKFTIDDSFKSECFQTILTLDRDQMPSFCEIIWNNRRILSMQISNFVVM